MTTIPYPDLTRPRSDVAGVVDEIRAGRPFVPNLYRMLLWSPQVAAGWVGLANPLRFGGRLADRDRELVILLVAHLTESQYEWHHHAPLAARAGISAGELEAVSSWPERNAWSDRDLAFLDAASALVQRRPIPPGTAALLRVELGEPGVVELAATVAYYLAVSHFLAALEIGLESTDAP